ncbi:hypothetical protein AABB24_005437 [Solanum stoloniferum]|uniref:Translocon at the inner envelope membrane of chloroplasts 214 n=1 Tax=Solanum stoloniferum TaxID=62892 RepID=A0ABD2UX67_9SOLN
MKTKNRDSQAHKKRSHRKWIQINEQISHKTKYKTVKPDFHFKIESRKSIKNTYIENRSHQFSSTNNSDTTTEYRGISEIEEDEEKVMEETIPFSGERHWNNDELQRRKLEFQTEDPKISLIFRHLPGEFQFFLVFSNLYLFGKRGLNRGDLFRTDFWGKSGEV